MAKNEKKEIKRKEDLIEEVEDEENYSISVEEDKDNGKDDEKDDKKDKELEETKTRLLRLQADFVNFKKRTEREKTATINYALEGFVCALLPILDNFKIAMESEPNKDNGFYDGINLIYKQLMDTLRNNDVVEMEALGEEFDPNFHHAVFMEESDEYEAGKVIEVLQTGYLLKEKVIRPAMVKVAK